MKMLGRPFRRPDKSAWWLRWTDPISRKRITKSFHTKALAEHFYKMLYSQLNADVFVGTIGISLAQATGFYLETYELKGLSLGSKQEAKRVMNAICCMWGDVSTKTIHQAHFDAYIKSRKEKGLSPASVNKDIAYCKAFSRWASHRSRRYMSPDIEFFKLKTIDKPVKSLSVKQVHEILRACPHDEWRLKVLLLLCTGLRATDVDRMKMSQISVEDMLVVLVEQKTGKIKEIPLPDALGDWLKRFVAKRPKDADFLFERINVPWLNKQWRRFRPFEVTRQDFRRTNKTLLQKIASIGSVKSLLHSDQRVTDKYYTDQELVLRWKINQLPVYSWMDYDH